MTSLLVNSKEFVCLFFFAIFVMFVITNVEVRGPNPDWCYKYWWKFNVCTKSFINGNFVDDAKI